MFRSINSEFGNKYVFSITLITFLSALILFLSLSQTSAAKSTGYWSVLLVEGPSQWRPASSDENWQSLVKEQQLPAKVEIRTLDNAHAVIVHGFDKIELEPNSTINVAPEDDADSTTSIVQTAGKVGYSVQKRKASTFSVTAPYLVAVVKGTGFTVDINEDSTQVDVNEGTVSVSNTSDGATASVTAGMSANVSSSAPGVTTSTVEGSNSSFGVSAEGGTSGAGGVEGTNASVGIGIGVGGTSAGIGIGIGVGGASAGVGVGVGSEGVSASAGVGAGSVGASAGVGVGDSGVGASAGAGVGDSGVGASAGASADAGGVGASAGAGVGGVGVGVGADAGVGGVGIGVDVGGIGVGIGIGGAQ